MSRTLIVATALLILTTACKDDAKETPPVDLPTSTDIPAGYDPATAYAVDLDPTTLSADVTNPLYPLPVGAKWVFRAETDEGLERTEVVVEAATRTVFGADARVVRDTVWLDGELIEDTYDWYAQDAAGNVWYLGEETAEYEDGEVTSTAGSWEAGVSGALPGVVMLAQPKVEDTYRQEFLVGEAEDVASVVAKDVSVEISAGSYSGCLKTLDTSTLERSLLEHKYYCPGVGVVLTEEDDVRDELVEVTGL